MVFIKYNKCLLTICIVFMLCPRRSKFQNVEDDANNLDGTQNIDQNVDVRSPNKQIEEDDEQIGAKRVILTKKNDNTDMTDGNALNEATDNGDIPESNNNLNDGYADKLNSNDDEHKTNLNQITNTETQNSPQEFEKRNVDDQTRIVKVNVNPNIMTELAKEPKSTENRNTYGGDGELKLKDGGSDGELKLKHGGGTILQDATVTLWTGLQNAEPGFDFTKEEMARLKIWPRGYIPFYIDEYSFDNTLQNRLRDAIHAINSITGLHFSELQRPPDDDRKRWVFFVNRRGILPCVDYTSKNFTNEGVQKVVLGYDCLTMEKSLGSLILALAGVPPQHNAPNRDNYIEVQMENVLPDKRHLFEIVPNNEWLFHDVAYDFSSAGHYDIFKYTANGRATIKPLGFEPVSLDEEGLSYGDLWKIRMIYNYISRNTHILGKSECSKMFVPGRKFKNFRFENGDDTTPRKKPNKFLGIEDDHDSKPNTVEDDQDDDHQNRDQSQEQNQESDSQEGNDEVTSDQRDKLKDDDNQFEAVGHDDAEDEV